jgi:hypothetical protein
MTQKHNSGLQPSAAEIPEKEIAALIQVVEKVLRKFICLLIGRVSLKKLQEMIQIIFVEEAEKKLKQETPGKNIPLSTLAVVSGLDTRTITGIKTSKNYMKPFHKADFFLSTVTPECSILDIWESNPKYTDLKSGKPIALAIKGPEPSFESLVVELGSARGVSIGSFLKRLEASQSIEVDHAGNSVRMVNKRYIPNGPESQNESIKVGMAVVSNLLDTVSHNVAASITGGETFYQQGSWTNRLNKTDRQRFRKLLRKFLLEADERARKVIRPFEQEMVCDNQVTAGFSMFYFEDDSPD